MMKQWPIARQAYTQGVVFLVCILELSAQDTVRLSEVEVQSLPSFHASSLGNKSNIDFSSPGMTSLWSASGFSLRTTGPNASVLFGLSGMPSAYTQTLWMGFPINSPTLGTYDFSFALSGQPTTRWDVYTGAESAYLGSGSAGGVVDVTPSSPLVDEPLSFVLSSLGNATLRFPWRHGPASQSVLSLWNAPNAFRYTDYLGVLRKRIGADSRGLSHHWMGQWGHRSAALWVVGSHMGLPESASSAYRLGARQGDVQVRGTLARKSQWKGWETQWSQLMTMEYQKYISVPIQDTHTTLGWKMQGVTEKNWKQWSVHSSVGSGYVGAFGPSHDLLWIREDFAKMAVQKKSGWGTLGLWARHDQRVYHQSLHSSPMQGGVHVQRRQQWRVSIARHFRFPTLNDLAWKPGGNPALLPERGTILDGTALLYAHPSVRIRTGFKATSLLESIVWLPQGNRWRPVNSGKLRSMAWETGMDWKIRRWSGQAKYTYVASTWIFSIPHRLWADVQYSRGKWKVEVQGIGQSSTPLIAKPILSIHLGVEYQGKHATWRGEMDNALGIENEWIPYYPQPKFNPSITCKIPIQ